ncbi:Methyltransferase type 12 [Sulfitobacter noctilucae]|uniref:class I SAM-dependent methyltransferase n=1 Tax=Sulfitobacter noctilucae TaxID=1342302 RepID=UPI0004690E60|nr:methyltransferase domain-containing protein [Sulfitobacter noctilucae]KIN61297.1 Methyltransferase type 12 [Sulfitobacter noctilucae]
MSSDPMAAFFTLHSDLPREGPGEAADVAWAAKVANLSPTAQIADVACGPGGDIAALLQAAPKGHVSALDKTASFVTAARRDWREDDRVTLLQADMARIMNSYDMIWCAGAVYFMGVEQALRAWRKSLKPGGVVAFSEVCWFTDAPSERPKALWEAQYPGMTDAAGIAAQITAAGYETVETRILSDAAWEAYFRPIDARIAALRPGADADLTAVLDEAEEEAACWRAHRDEFGYLLSVVRPR